MTVKARFLAVGRQDKLVCTGITSGRISKNDDLAMLTCSDDYRASRSLPVHRVHVRKEK